MKTSFCLWKPTTVDSLPTSAMRTMSTFRSISCNAATLRERWSPRMKRSFAMAVLRADVGYGSCERCRRTCPPREEADLPEQASELLEHHVGVDEAKPGVFERFGQGTDDIEAQFLPERDGASVGGNDMVEL